MYKSLNKMVLNVILLIFCIQSGYIKGTSINILTKKYFLKIKIILIL